MDNPDADLAGGTWTVSGASGDKYMADYAYATTVTGAATQSATYTPNIMTAGYYDISVWYPAGGNRPTDASHYISYDGGSTTVTVNQTANGGGWRSLTTGKHFLAGLHGYVRISNSSATAGKVVMADGVKFAYSSKNQTITFPPVASVIYGQPAPTATVTSGLAANYTVLAGPAWVSNNIVVITNTGTVTIQADQPGNASFFAANPATLTFIVSPNALKIAPTKTNSVVVSWPVPAGGWVLERTNALPQTTVSWPQISPPYQTNTTQSWIVVPSPTEPNYYRLRKP
jgi:hypothetical protein